MTGDPTECRNICIQCRVNTMQTIRDNHRSYDALQYPLIFWEGEDGFHLNIKQRNSTTGEETDQENATNDINNIGTAYILPSSYSGSPCHMHEYIQDAMTYVREYGRPDLFITFTCNPNWDEIKNLLFSGQTSMLCHDITAHVFKQKLKSLINLITHHLVFGKTRCCLYSVEWQKCGLQHAHILIWLVAKVHPEEMDKIISAEIPDQNANQELFAIVTTNMIHRPCGTLNMM
ncbi:ATP-dependent DNA helicase [Trichonephila clavipes]|uniref:ATP-dependent DNA helicase n=1 Tax=Trichonephila clavipes TaxID=2585209 RepID=A0A8X6SWU6_TRICX|nr:ATP-dependent DNA helicase [Trichonephila clavipes]